MMTEQVGSSTPDDRQYPTLESDELTPSELNRLLQATPKDSSQFRELYIVARNQVHAVEWLMGNAPSGEVDPQLDVAAQLFHSLAQRYFDDFAHPASAE